jgi:polar amino acid transport system substrate-binding protein
MIDRRAILGALTAVAVLGSAVAGHAADKVLKFGAAAEPYPPFTSQTASGKWVGFEVDLMNAVCKVEKLKCQMVGTAWDGIIPALNAHKIDVIWSSMSITPERAKVIDFTDKYYNTPADIIAPKSEKLPLTTKDMSALYGKTIGVQTSTTHAAFVQKYLGSKVKLKTYDTQDNCDADLTAGRIDAAIADSVALTDYLKSDQGSDMEVKLTIPADFDRSVFGDGVGGGLRKSDTALKAKLNDGIKKVRANGTYDKLAKKYFDFDVFGS